MKIDRWRVVYAMDVHPAEHVAEAVDELYRRFRAGHSHAFDALYDQLSGPLLFYARSLPCESAEDLVQEAFLRLLQQTSAAASVRGFLFTVVRNLARDRARRIVVRQREAPLLMVRPQHQPEVDAARVSAALQALPDEQREAVVLKAYGELTFAEIAAVTGLPLGTVLSRYRYALQELARLLEAER
jgi:RNA polymerase sigma-70 factor (ECF subfamily)